MLDRLVEDSGVAEEVLIREFKAVHEKYGTSEYSFSIEELPSLRKKFGSKDLAKRFEDSIRAYREARKAAEKLYPEVLETLETLKDKGCLLIGYTESAEFHTARRMKRFALDRILDYIWSSPDTDMPPGLRREAVRKFSDDYYHLRRTVHHTLPKGELKPNPEVLADIIRSIGADIGQTIYVGDNLMKDISMAQSAGVTSVWAKYGDTRGRPEYELLKRVTHWGTEDVEREKRLTSKQVSASHALEANFGELLAMFTFTPFLSTSRENLSLVLDIWKKTVDVQQHFNDLELRIRNYALTVLAALWDLRDTSSRKTLRSRSFAVTPCQLHPSCCYSRFYRGSRSILWIELGITGCS
jgi:FMN phosphatase YigB (HAD superfamily)